MRGVKSGASSGSFSLEDQPCTILHMKLERSTSPGESIFPSISVGSVIAGLVSGWVDSRSVVKINSVAALAFSGIGWTSVGPPRLRWLPSTQPAFRI
jgi:hypothetical protein